MYNLAIIGGGPAGYNAALRAAELGMETILIERAELGGTCLNRGCIPTKCLLKSAEVYKEAVECGVFGVATDNVTFDYEKMYARKDKIVEKLRNGIEFLIKKSSLDYIQGEAKFVDSHTLQVGDTFIEAKNIMIACGSRPSVIPIAGAQYTLNSDDVLANPLTANEIIIIGGGVIGTEYASLFSSLGKNVTIIEYESRILPLLDIDAANSLTMSLKKRGVKIILNAKVTEIRKEEKLTVVAEVKGESKEFLAESVIVSIGRVANIDSLALENAGVNYDRRIIVDKNCRTNIPNIFSVGDASAKIQLAHYAEAEAVCVVERLAGKKASIDLNTVPSAVYTNPELAMVGRTVAFENEKLFSAKTFMMANGKANIEDSTSGFVKTVYNEDGIIVGAVVVNSRATDIIGELALAVTNKLSVDDIIKTVHPHPTLCEAIRISAEDAKKTILKNQEV